MKKFINFKRNLEEYFEKNLTGYSYLFFAQFIVIAENKVWGNELKGPYGKIPLHSITGYMLIGEITVLYILLPLLFLIAAFTTFKYPKNKSDSFLIILLNIIIGSFIIMYGLLTTV